VPEFARGSGSQRRRPSGCPVLALLGEGVLDIYAPCPSRRHITSQRYHVSVAGAHALSAQACLGILLHLDKAITTSGLAKLPLAEYAAEHWVDHAQFKEVAQNLEAGMKLLFDPRKPHFAVWIGIHDLKPSRSQRYLTRTPLHYAAFYGLHRIIEFLVVERSQGVLSLDLSDKPTPLHAAASSSYSASAEAARALLEHGADTMAKDRNRCTPLHEAAERSSLTTYPLTT
jgi:hypothetical protein